MTAQLLIYQRAVPVSAGRHKDMSIRMGADYGFARKVNSVPLLAAEFPNAAAEYAIVFAGTGDNVMPMVILGIREGENLHVDGSGKWDAKYIPAFVRRYPFVFSSTDEGKTFTLCIDEEFAGCNTNGEGERLFDASGERTQYLQGVLGFLQAFQAQFQRTEIYCRKLKELGLLEPMQARFTLTGGQRVQLGGFMAVNRNKLKGVAGDKLAELASTDELELTYLHLASLRHLTGLVQRMGSVQTAEGAPQPPADDTAPPADGGTETTAAEDKTDAKGGARAKAKAKA